MDSSPSPFVRVSIQPGGDDGCKIVRYESATSDFVDVEEALNEREQALRDIGKLEQHEFMLEQKKAEGGSGFASAAGAGGGGASLAQTMILRESSKMKMVKELLMAATSGTPSMVAMAAVVKDAVDEGLRVAAKGQQIAEAVVLLRKHAQELEKKASKTVATLRDLKHKLKPLWLTLPINHQIQICIGSDTYGGDIPCNASIVRRRNGSLGLHWGVGEFLDSDIMKGRVSVICSTSSMSPPSLSAWSRDCLPHSLPFDVHNQLSVMLWRTLGRQMLLDCSTEVLQSAAGTSPFAIYHGWLHSQQLSIIWSKKLASAAISKKTDSAIDEHMADADASGVDAFFGRKRSSLPADDANDSESDPESDHKSADACEDKYSRLIGLRSTLAKCRARLHRDMPLPRVTDAVMRAVQHKQQCAAMRVVLDGIAGSPIGVAMRLILHERNSSTHSFSTDWLLLNSPSAFTSFPPIHIILRVSTSSPPLSVSDIVGCKRRAFQDGVAQRISVIVSKDSQEAREGLVDTTVVGAELIVKGVVCDSWRKGIEVLGGKRVTVDVSGKIDTESVRVVGGIDDHIRVISGGNCVTLQQCRGRDAIDKLQGCLVNILKC